MGDASYCAMRAEDVDARWSFVAVAAHATADARRHLPLPVSLSGMIITSTPPKRRRADTAAASGESEERRFRPFLATANWQWHAQTTRAYGASASRQLAFHAALYASVPATATRRRAYEVVKFWASIIKDRCKISFASCVKTLSAGRQEDDAMIDATNTPAAEVITSALLKRARQWQGPRRGEINCCRHFHHADEGALFWSVGVFLLCRLALANSPRRH